MDVPKKNFFDEDTNLQSILERIVPDALNWRATLSDFGAWAGIEVDNAAAYTDRYARPVLEAYGADGAAASRVRYNPGWQTASREVYRRGIVGLNYGADPAPFAITFAMGYLLAQADISLHCPVTMTGAVAYVLDRFAPPGFDPGYHASLTRMDGTALTGGTWATELHGGSDVGASTTRATPDGETVRLDGLKWFTSNPDGGLALATARPDGAADGPRGLGLYLVPWRLGDGSLNRLRLRRLKDKLGTTGIATGEVELTGAHAIPFAAPPDGLRLMMEALLFSRLHNAMASVGIQRRAFSEVLAYARARPAFGDMIANYPMVRDELLAILVALEAGCALAFEAVRAFDAADRDPDVKPWLRMATALAKFRTAEDAVSGCRRAMEIVGGNAYTADLAFERLYRDAAVLPIWEGPANIQALELMRLLGNDQPGDAAFRQRMQEILDGAPAALEGISARVAGARDECLAALDIVRGDGAEAQRHARRVMGMMADAVSAALLLEEAGRDYAKGDRRKALIAELYLDSRRPSAGILSTGEPDHHRHFNALADGAPIAVTKRRK